MKLPRVPQTSAVHEFRRRFIDDILSGPVKPGQTLETTSEMSARYEVSTATINRAMRQLRREGWVERKAGKGTYIGPRALMGSVVDQSRSTPKALRIAVALLPLDFLVSDWHAQMLLQGVDRAAGEHEATIELLGSCGRDNDLFARRLQQSNPDVVVFLKPLIRNAPLLREAERLGKPCIATGTRWRDLDIPTVEEDGFGGAVIAVRELVAAGHERIALFLPDAPEHLWFDRRRGYEAAMKEALGDFDRNLIFWTEDRNEVDPGASERVENFIREQKPTAAFFMQGHDLELMSPLVKAGRLRVPQDISVVCFDARYDFYRAILPAKPTVINPPLMEMGRKVVELAAASRKGAKIPARTVLPCTWIAGETIRMIS